DCPPSRRLGCSSLAIAPVQPVWCEAPTPRPLPQPIALRTLPTICGLFIFQQRYGFVRAWSSAGSQRPVQIVRRANQGEMGESLGEVAQGLAAMPGLCRIEADMVGEAELPAARCRNCRRGSFILNPPSPALPSITPARQVMGLRVRAVRQAHGKY